jgi:Flp pilus assembly protein TadD
MANTRLEQVMTLLKAEPDDAFLNHALAMEYIAAGEDKRAIVVMEHLLEVHGDHTGTYYHLGHAYLREGNKEAALMVWEKGIITCKLLKKQHHLAELQSAYNEVMFGDD